MEWKWDGIRCQLVKRDGEVFLWSRGEELINDSFPDILRQAELLPDGTVLDGELLPFKEGKVLSFATLQTRLNRKKITKKRHGGKSGQYHALRYSRMGGIVSAKKLCVREKSFFLPLVFSRVSDHKS